MSNKTRKTKRVLMVCVDNICRSPMAEAVLNDVIVKDGLQEEWCVDSAAIEAWHLGAPPDVRALNVLSHHNIIYHSYARRLIPEDFKIFDYILAMDQSILASLKVLEPHYSRAELLLLGDFLFGLKPNERIIEDPYYNMGESSFEKIYEQCRQACSNFRLTKMVQKILMICLGNICRSPIAEVVMVDVLTKAKLEIVVDSAAIGSWHVGNRSDPRALSTLEQHGLKSTHIVRQITKNDFEVFDYIFGMDEENMEELNRLAPKGSKAELLMLGDFGLSIEKRIIEDPYYQRGAAGFETAYQQCVVACEAFVKERLQN